MPAYLAMPRLGPQTYGMHDTYMYVDDMYVDGDQLKSQTASFGLDAPHSKRDSHSLTVVVPLTSRHGTARGMPEHEGVSKAKGTGRNGQIRSSVPAAERSRARKIPLSGEVDANSRVPLVG
jgi:hypothetical protein